MMGTSGEAQDSEVRMVCSVLDSDSPAPPLSLGGSFRRLLDPDGESAAGSYVTSQAFRDTSLAHALTKTRSTMIRRKGDAIALRFAIPEPMFSFTAHSCLTFQVEWYLY
jgi:hypothetical protein